MGFGFVVLSGFLMFAIDATEIAANPAFRLKLLLILGTGINAVVFHGGPYKSVKMWNRGVEAPIVVKMIAVLSLVLWTAVIICGRLIAYI
jgi:predicted membrane protein